MEVSFNFWSILFLIVASQGLMLGILLLLKKTSRIQNIQLLSILIVSFSLMLFYYVAFWTGYSRQIHRLWGIPYSFSWLVGPICYQYIRSITVKDKFQYWHYIPFSVFLCFLLVASFVYEPRSFFQAAWANFNLLLVIQLMAYAFAIFRFNKTHSDHWTRLIGYLYFGFLAGNLTYFSLVWTGLLNPTYDYIISLFISGFIYSIGYYGFNEEQLFIKKKYSNSELTNTALRFLGNKLEEVMDKEKPYLEHSISLQELAEKVDISKHQLSQVINECFQMNFFDFVNSYRIRDAIEILKQPDNYNIKLNQLAIKVGFNNKVTFNNAFKKVTGKSPSLYKKGVHEMA